MPFEITMPQLGLTMENGTIVEWLVSAGERVTPGQEILQVETDKAVVVVEAHEEGTIARILVPAGQQVAVGSVLAVGVAPGESLPADWQPEQAAGAEGATETPGDVTEVTTQPLLAGGGARQASWKARRLAREAGLDWRTVQGSGPGGRIVALDISQSRPAAAAPTERPAPAETVRVTPVAANLAAALGLDVAHLVGSGPQGVITQSDVLEAAAAIIQRNRVAATPAGKGGLPQVAATTPLKGVRKIVSEGMAASVHTTARVTLFREVVASELVAWRERLKARGVDISYNDLLVQICAAALKDHPEANARLGNDAIEQLDRINVGVAVDTDRGLLVPVIHDADRLTLPQIAAESVRLIEGARDGRSLPDDLSGGTFTITNLGMFGVDGFTPVINLPECCILGMGRIVRKPVASEKDDSVTVRPVMTLSLVFDHRVIDGAPAARLLNRIAELVEDPMLLLTIW